MSNKFYFPSQKQIIPHLFQACTQKDSPGLMKCNLNWILIQYRLNHMYNFQLIKLRNYKLFGLSAHLTHFFGKPPLRTDKLYKILFKFLICFITKIVNTKICNRFTNKVSESIQNEQTFVMF